MRDEWELARQKQSGRGKAGRQGSKHKNRKGESKRICKITSSFMLLEHHAPHFKVEEMGGGGAIVPSSEQRKVHLSPRLQIEKNEFKIMSLKHHCARARIFSNSQSLGNIFGLKKW